MAKHIFVFGSPGSGKSIFCTALAKVGIKQKKRSMIVCADRIIPMIPFFGGSEEILGLGALCAKDITPKPLAKAVKVIKKYPDIGILGMNFEDDPSSITREKYEQIFHLLDSIVDIVIWDGNANMYDPMHLAVSHKADLQICILTADVKGILYFENYRHIIRDKGKYILLEGLAKPYTAYEEMSALIGGFDGRLNYSREVERVCLEGKVFSVDDVCQKEYKDLTEQLIEKVLHGEEA